MHIRFTGNEEREDMDYTTNNLGQEIGQSAVEGEAKKRGAWKKALKITGITLASAVVLAGGLVWAGWGNEIRTVASFEKIADRNDEHMDGSVYEMNVAGGYYFEDFLAQGGASSDSELIDFITGKITKGLVDMTIKESEIACSSFTAVTEDGDRVFGRNYDFSKTNTCLVYTNPGKGRHASVSTIDLQFLGMDVNSDVDGLMNKITCLAAPYVPLDGVNDAGVSCGIYMTYQGKETVATDQNTEKPDLTSTTLLRLILDYADSVDEAVELISAYDLHDSAKTSYHYMVADAEGNSAVLEWVAATDNTDNDGSKRELRVIYNDNDPRSASAQNQCVTNFVLSPDYYENEEDMKGLDRYERLQQRIAERGGVVKDEEDAMRILQEVGRRTWNNDDKNSCTVHSVVYNLTDKTALWVPNEHFGEEAYIQRMEVK